jgi:hypothetical protein
MYTDCLKLYSNKGHFSNQRAWISPLVLIGTFSPSKLLQQYTLLRVYIIFHVLVSNWYGQITFLQIWCIWNIFLWFHLFWPECQRDLIIYSCDYSWPTGFLFLSVQVICWFFYSTVNVNLVEFISLFLYDLHLQCLLFW